MTKRCIKLLALLTLMLSGFETLVAQTKLPVRMRLEPMSIRGRSGGAIPLKIKLEYNSNQIMEGDLPTEGLQFSGCQQRYAGVNSVRRDRASGKRLYFHNRLATSGTLLPGAIPRGGLVRNGVGPNSSDGR